MTNPALIYTSGALTQDVAAWAFVTQHQGDEVHKYGCLQADGDPLTGHLAALIKALEWAAEYQIKRLVVYTDSQAALDALQATPPAGSPLIASSIPLYLHSALEALGGRWKSGQMREPRSWRHRPPGRCILASSPLGM
jgi:ribonuclease HI